MIKIVNGMRYDTDAATLLASSYRAADGGRYDNGIRRDLYRTAKGVYFVREDTLWGDAHNAIIPIAKSHAMSWWEKMEPCSDYEEAFGIAPVDA